MANIVVMEDDMIVRDIIVRVLQMEGHQVQAFGDARPALDTVDFSQVDLVLTDIQMPTSGEEAIRVIRSLGAHPPIIAMSAAMDPPKIRHLLSLGVQEVLEKPFRIRDLLEPIRKWI